MRRPALLLISLAVGLLFIRATAANALDQPGSQTVTAVGESVIYEGNVAQAKERALQEVFSTAITQVMGTFITAESYSQNFVSIDRSVLSKTKGYVKTYEIVETTQQADNLILKANVVVSTENIKDDLTALGILLDAMGNPVIQIQARDEGLDTSESGPVLKQFLTEKGFYIVDMAKDKQPDVVIILAGKINSQNHFGGTGLTGAVVALEAKALQQSTGKLIASKDVVANGAGLNDTVARTEAYRKAAENLSPQLVEAITEKWGQELTSGRPLQVTLEVNDYDKLQRFARELERIFGVKKVDLKSFQNNEAQCLVRFAGQTKTLADLVVRRPLDKLSVYVQRFDSDSLVLSVN